MRQLLKYIPVLLAISPLFSSCLSDDPTDTTQSPWRQENDEWIQAKIAESNADGTPVYERVGCNWDPNAYVLMQWHNDRTTTASELTPYSTSTVDVRYEVRTIDGTLVDSSTARTTPAPGIYRSTLNKNIAGWVIGVSNMHVGDTCTILIPYEQAYGSVAYNGLKPYSSLIFNVRLAGIPAWEKPL